MKRMIVLLTAALVACGGSKLQQAAPPVPPLTGDIAGGVAPKAPGNPDVTPLPLASDVKKGVLPNGLTYYIKKHGKPEKRALLWLAVDAGSMLEDDDQTGLAHFDEHMSFNGTKRFPKQQIIDYLQSIGMRFGADLNAYTNQNETVYQLEVPTEPQFIGKGLDILRDWAGDATYDDKEVKSESGVVLEEWRLGRSANRRLYDKHRKVLMKGTRYAARDTIGNPETLKKADRSALYRFYKDWYRPDNMAIVLVGDFDPAEVEKAVLARFSDLANPGTERAKVTGGVPKAEGTRISIESDKELAQSQVAIHSFIAHRPKATIVDLHRIVLEQVYQAVVNERYAVLRRRADAPFMNAFAGTDGENRETDDFVRSATAKNGKLEESLRTLLTEALRVERHGITQPELDRAKIVLARAFDENAERYQTLDSRDVVAELVRNFLEKEFVILPEEERDLSKKALASVTVDDINADLKTFGGAENRAIEVSLPTTEKAITEDRVKAIIGEVEKSNIPAWEDKAIPTALMTNLPKPGKITKEKTFEKIGVYQWTLSNGATVIIKPSDFEKDSVSFVGDSPGGTGLASDADYRNARFATAIAQLGGVGDFDADTLTKVLAGKQVSMGVTMSETSEGLSGSGSAKDVETMMQLAYLHVTAPRKDEEQFRQWQLNGAESLANQERSPQFQYFKRSTSDEYKDNVRRTLPKPEDYGKADLDKALAFYKARFADVSDWNFVIVGDVDLAKLRPLVETYLASLPGKGRKDAEKDLGIRKVSGVVKKEYDLGVEPKATVRLDFHGADTWSLDKERDAYTLAQVLSNLLREELREEKGGVYGVGAFGNVQRKPYQERAFGISFGCAPDRVDELLTALNEVVAKVMKDGVDADHLDKIKQIYTRGRETELRTNRFWSQRLTSAFRFKDDPNDIPDTTKTLARMTSDNVKAAAKHFLDPKTLFQAVQMPVKAEPPAKK